MKAIILAAGRGSRMKGLTDDRPKCLNVLAGKPLIQWQLEALAAAGITDVVLVGGYLKDGLSGFGCPVLDNPRWAETNMLVSLTMAAEHLRREPCVVSYSDIVYHPDNVRALVRGGGDIAIAYDRHWRPLWEARFPDPLADAETFVQQDGKLLAIGDRAESVDEIQGQYMGLLLFTPTGWNTVENLLAGLPGDTVDKLDMTALLKRLLAQGERIHTHPVDGRWCECDSGDDLKTYEGKLAAGLADGKPWTHDWR